MPVGIAKPRVVDCGRRCGFRPPWVSDFTRFEMYMMLSYFRCLAVALAMIATIAMAAVAVPAPALAAKTDTVGLVKQVENDAFGTSPGAKREKKLLRYPVFVDELLETTTRANMLVEFLDETTLTLGPSSRLRVDTMVYDPNAGKGTMVINLTVGVFRYVSGKMQGGDVRIVTPSMVLGVRGSEALIIVAPDGSTTVNVFSGTFSVSNLVGVAIAVVTAAQSVSVTPTGRAGSVVSGPAAPPPEMRIQPKKSGASHGLDKTGDSEGYGGDARGGGRTGSSSRATTIDPPRVFVPSIPRSSSY